MLLVDRRGARGARRARVRRRDMLLFWFCFLGSGGFEGDVVVGVVFGEGECWV